MNNRAETLQVLVHKAISKHCEQLEIDKKYIGNGHHLAQRLADMIEATTLQEANNRLTFSAFSQGYAAYEAGKPHPDVEVTACPYALFSVGRELFTAGYAKASSDAAYERERLRADAMEKQLIALQEAIDRLVTERDDLRGYATDTPVRWVEAHGALRDWCGYRKAVCVAGVEETNGIYDWWTIEPYERCGYGCKTLEEAQLAAELVMGWIRPT